MDSRAQRPPTDGAERLAVLLIVDAQAGGLWNRSQRSSCAMPGVLSEGDALVIMLALELVPALDQQVAPLGLTAADTVLRLSGVRPVGLGEH